MINQVKKGARFGILRVLEEVSKPGVREPLRRFSCICDCGKPSIRTLSYLKGMRGVFETPSCGCLTSSTKHLHNHYLYEHYKHMLKRCYDVTHPEYSNYGGKGVTVCKEWYNNLEAYINYVESIPRPKLYKKKHIDLVEPGNFEPGNIIWVKKSGHNS